ncbi:MAG: DUF6152 family protein [Rhodospirillaceae bacterium]|nr:DUF6152 family protein [Rhodospirillaceae bacterium]
MGVFPSDRLIAAVALAIAAAPFIPQASAHHSMALFDGSRLLSVEGTVSQIIWRSPHVYVMVEADEGGEAAEWRFEALPVPIMIREGWTEDSLGVGEQVTVEGYPLRESDAKYMWLRRVVKADGTVLDPGQIPGSPGTPTEGQSAN